MAGGRSPRPIPTEPVVAAPHGVRRYSDPVTSPDRPTPVRPVEYKGEPLDSERGPGLGCFRFQVGLLVVAIVLTPLSVIWEWPSAVSAALLFLTILLLLFAGQTIIFLLRLVAADRREGRRRPLASATPTVGELEERATRTTGLDADAPSAHPTANLDETPATGDDPGDGGSGPRGVRE
jgi:hypothetical protein